MTQITIYTKDYCPYCKKAKELLDSLGQSFTEIDLTKEPTRRDEMIQQAGGRTTVPQIFIDGEHIGGCDDLHKLHETGELVGKFAA